ncbi:epithelial-stromal interaction protein 1 isoform X1 [Thunnus thynnus]|uniref:epithelial-stromal interaction protein 1 isoform X1 n=1 Tax=Thunnus thynnus TaxID=8237 RepID=UPI0035278F52
MDPYYNQGQRNPVEPRRNPATNPRDRNRSSDMSGNEATPDNFDRNAPDSGNPQGTDRQAQYSGGFTMIPPNESRRSKITTMAQKEEEEFQRWKESHRAPPVHLNPERLGGDGTLAEARRRQLTDLRCSKLQKKLKQEDLDKRRRQEEEEKSQRMKAEQREKAERLEEKRRQEEQKRREQFRQDHRRRTDDFLQRFERRAPGPLASSSATHTSSGSEALKTKQRETPVKSEREVEEERRRVNSAFLDKLEGRSRESETEAKRESFSQASEVFRHQPSNTPGQQLPPTHLRPDPGQDRAEEADPQPDYEWDLMKLMSNFPDCSRVFLEDILDQCNGDYEQAYTILISSLS